MYSFQMLFDKEETWHFDPSTPPGPGETDMWAVASHEFGHAGGRITGGPGDQGHWPESSNLCPDLLNDRRHTMCPSYDFIGTVMRTLERHDIDTFRNAYGRR
ncbi:MAG: Matrixin [Actinomycetota bacterium]|nr:Matrixin [Actinomycetota bacterium]